MNIVFTVVPLLILGIGHLAIWSRLFCWIHARNYAQWFIDVVEYAIYAATIFIPIAYVWILVADFDDSISLAAIYGYAALCLVALLVSFLTWLDHCRDFRRAQPYYQQVRLVLHDFKSKSQNYLGSSSTRVANNIPGNQILKLEVTQKTLFLPCLPEDLDGLTITHISDLHLKGHMEIDFYREIVVAANDLNSEMMVVTGDLFDKDKCFAWTESIFAQLSADSGVYFILGNHELRLKDIPKARKILIEAGLIDVGGRHQSMMVRNTPVILLGNEMPWHPPQVDARTIDDSQFSERPFKIALSHSPDQIQWARHAEIDLMLSGHNHGGQIRLPYLGAIVSPSDYGTRYASGVFYEEPTLLHVSRGVSGTNPLRINCPPEITQLILKKKQSSD